MNIVIAGGTGQIGKALLRKFKEKNFSVTVLSRTPEHSTDLTDVVLKRWDARTLGDWCAAIEGADIVMNLSGASIAERRWSNNRKRELLESRIQSTRILVQALSSASSRPHTFVNASAIGFYGDTIDTVVNEDSPRGKGYLSELCVQWEEEALTARKFVSRTIILRIGVILEKDQGALKRMVLPFKLWSGGHLGSGTQWIGWIHRDDLVSAILFILGAEKLDGPVNLTSPYPVPMKIFAQELGKVLHRPSWLPVPSLPLRLLLGEMSTIVLEGQRALPDKLLSAGFTFQYPTIDMALANIFTSRTNRSY